MTGCRLAWNLSQFRLVTFDITDTLLRFNTAPAVQYAKSAASFGYSNVDQRRLENAFKSEFKKMTNDHPNFALNTEGMDWRDWWRKLVINIFNKADERIPLDDLKIIAEKLIDQYGTEECWLKVDGADEIVCKIKELDKKVGVISNFDPRLHHIVKSLKLPDFDFILTSYEVGVTKPDLKIFQTAQKFCAVHGKESLHIGNTVTADYFGAINAGWSSIHISNSSDEWEAYTDVNRNHVFKSITSLLEALECKTISWT